MRGHCASFADVVSIAIASIAIAAAASACVQVENQAPSVDYMELTPDYARRAPVDVAILRTDALAKLDADVSGKIRQSLYDLMMEKGYAPLSFEYVDDLMRKKGALSKPLSTRYSWNIETCRDLLFCDGLMAVSIESFSEPGMPGSQGIEIWGKVALFDAKSLDVLYEHYIRRNLYVSDPGSRDKYVSRAILDFTRDLLAYLPDKPERLQLEPTP